MRAERLVRILDGDGNVDHGIAHAELGLQSTGLAADEDRDRVVFALVDGVGAGERGSGVDDCLVRSFGGLGGGLGDLVGSGSVSDGLVDDRGLIGRGLGETEVTPGSLTALLAFPITVMAGMFI